MASSKKNITKLKHRSPFRQLRRIPRFFRHHWPVIVLAVIALALSYLNYDQGTFITGWDNLHPEFNTQMNLQRTLFSVWQEYRSTGLLSGQAPAADLPRILLITLFEVFKISSNLSRYLTTFLPLVLGPIGVYLLFYHHLFREKLDSATTQYASFFGGLFYLFNLGTLQTFFVPFETFTWFYGSLPYLLYFTLSYFKKPSWGKLFTLSLVSLIAAPSFYVETIFIILFVVFIPFFLEYFFSHHHRPHSVKHIFTSSISIILPHLFWLLPVIFFVFTEGHNVEVAKINSISSAETFYRNLEFASIKDLALIKGYLFNYLDMTVDYKYDYLLSIWRNHLTNPLINIVGFLIFATAVTGFYYSIKKKFAWTKAFIGYLAICLFFLLGGGLLINRLIPLIGELFRSPFTKFAIPFSLCYSFFFAIGTIFILDLFTYLHSRLTYYLTLFTITATLFLFMSPAFSGHFISPKLRVTIPSEYFELFDYMKSQNHSTRIANFPQPDFWGWIYYDWGYRGSGFLWHGLKQPLMDRAFDVWERTSEQYYEELSTAIYSNRQDDFEKTIDKYAISWLLLDKHVISASGQTDLGVTTLENFLANSSKFSKVKSFGNKIDLYQKNPQDTSSNFLSLSNDKSEIYNIKHPFSNLSLRPNTDWIEKDGFLSTSVVIPSQSTENRDLKSVISIPSLTKTESMLPVRVEYQQIENNLHLRLSTVTPIILTDQKQIDLDSTPLEIDIPVSPDKNNFILQLDHSYSQIIIPAEVENVTSYQLVTTTYLPTNKSFSLNLFDSLPENSLELIDTLSQAEPAQCYTQKPNRKIEKIVTPNSVSLLGTDVVGCLSATLPSVLQGTLISLNFSYSSPTRTLANANISGPDLAGGTITQSLESGRQPRRAQIFSSSTGQDQQANFILEASDSKSVQEIEYRDISVYTHPLLFSSTQKLNSIPTKDVALENIQGLQVTLPVTDTSLDIINTPESNSLLPENLNCDQFNAGKTVKINDDEQILYQSQNAIECDYQNLRHLPHSLNYLISITTQNLKGLPLALCLENFTTRRCDTYDRLSDKNTTQYLLNPIRNDDESPGYTLHLFNQSIGNRITSNVLKNLSIRPIPLNFFKSISLSPSLENDKSTMSNEKYSISSSHPAEFLYTVSIPQSENRELKSDISLYQTKSPYWQALQVTQADLKLPTWLLVTKIFFTYPGLTKLPHNDHDLWHNSWPLSPICDLSSENCNLIIIYTPQYLEFLGLALIPSSLLLITIIKMASSPYRLR